MYKIESNKAITGIVALCFLMLFASMAMPVSAVASDNVNIQNGDYVGTTYTVSDSFIDVAFSCDSGAGSYVHNVTITFGDYNGTSEVAKIIIPATDARIFTGSYILENIADGNYSLAVDFTSNLIDNETYTSFAGESQHVIVSYVIDNVPYMPNGINNKFELIDYLWFTLTVMVASLIIGLAYFKIVKNKTKDKIIEHMMVVLFLSFFLTFIMWILIGNPLGMIWGYLESIWAWIIGLFNGWV
jgi:hypothetical protein